MSLVGQYKKKRKGKNWDQVYKKKKNVFDGEKSFLHTRKNAGNIDDGGNVVIVENQ